MKKIKIMKLEPKEEIKEIEIENTLEVLKENVLLNMFRCFDVS